MNTIKLIGSMLVALLLFTGCNDLLEDPSPATSLPSEEVLTSEDGVDALRSALYSKLRASFDYTTEYFVGPSAIADESRNRPGSSRFQGLTEITGNDGGTNGLTSYIDTYDVILDANLLISGVEDENFEESYLETLQQYRGEAYAVRAMAMHHLVRVLGYEPGQEVDGFDLGIVIRTEPTFTIEDVGSAPRATNAEVYDQILSDLNEAKTLLEGRSDDTRITEAFVDGLIARVNLYAGNWGDADEAAENAINNSGKSLENTESGVELMFDENLGGHPEALFKLVVNPNTEPIAGSNVNDGLAGYTTQQWIAQLPTNFVIDLYEEDDYRLQWFEPCFDEENQESVAGCTDVNDEGWEIQKWGGEKGSLADDIPYMRLAEMYLIRAEAAAKDQDDYTAGLPYLNDLREARGLDDLVAGTDISSLEELEDEVLDERVRELAFEGHRFFDLKRLERDILNPDGSTKIRYDSYRILDDISSGNISSNPELVENPGY